MKEQLKLKLEGFGGEFIINPMPLSKGLLLSRKIEKMTLEALKAFDTLKEPIIDMILGDSSDEDDTDLVNMLRTANVTKIMEVFIQVLSTMNDTQFLNFVQELLAYTQYTGDTGAVEFTEVKVIDNVFAGNISAIYKLLFEVIKYNNFTPFALAGIGNLIPRTNTSTLPVEIQNDSESS